MKRNGWFEFAIISLLLVSLSCSKDNEKGSEGSNCYVIETVDDDVTPYYYDDNDRLKQIGDGAEYDLFIYEGDKLVKHEMYDEDGLGEYLLVFWNESTIDSLQFYYKADGENLQFWVTFKYEFSNGKLSKLTADFGEMVVELNYEWANNNVTKLTTCYNDDCSASVYYYDNNINMWKPIQPYFYFYSPENMSANNVIQIVRLDENDQPTGYNTFDYVYEYNERGYPVKVIKTEDGAEEEITYYSYNCK